MNISKQSYLGAKIQYSGTYNPDFLFSIKRCLNRKGFDIDDSLSLPFAGLDVWNAYEISWLQQSGKPVVAIGKFIFTCDSEYLVESKSLKLYLNSFNQTKFADVAIVKDTIQKDLSLAAGAPVVVDLCLLSEDYIYSKRLELMEGKCIDKEEIKVTDYLPNPSILKIGNKKTKEKLYSNLLKSNCLVTNQPDWASIQISYIGNEIDKGSLLKYIISYREHCEFHEHCVERIFMDIMRQCRPSALSVLAKYTRRGGIDINPFRTKNLPVPNFTRHVRQ